MHSLCSRQGRQRREVIVRSIEIRLERYTHVIELLAELLVKHQDPVGPFGPFHANHNLRIDISCRRRDPSGVRERQFVINHHLDVREIQRDRTRQAVFRDRFGDAEERFGCGVGRLLVTRVLSHVVDRHGVACGVHLPDSLHAERVSPLTNLCAAQSKASYTWSVSVSAMSIRCKVKEYRLLCIGTFSVVYHVEMTHRPTRAKIHRHADPIPAHDRAIGGVCLPSSIFAPERC